MENNSINQILNLIFHLERTAHKADEHHLYF
jgi:hypothetical protein